MNDPLSRLRALLQKDPGVVERAYRATEAKTFTRPTVEEYFGRFATMFLKPSKEVIAADLDGKPTLWTVTWSPKTATSPLSGGVSLFKKVKDSDLQNA